MFEKETYSWSHECQDEHTNLAFLATNFRLTITVEGHKKPIQLARDGKIVSIYGSCALYWQHYSTIESVIAGAPTHVRNGWLDTVHNFQESKRSFYVPT
ncbi:hypothetical protein Lwal_1023 [Legionella waltersii]|uniref:Uncharacterized protein n=2 Tax=Legionella waltersii TaxID=66969 RepID=A0A0W1AK66_9GAMM|nr:hypothetical protein Lwal_1023 [Legionella waltersii]SNV05675.1 Uncharacterised protein [Legionella waltersii]